MIKAKETRREAREMLKEQWGIGFAVLFLNILIIFILRFFVNLLTAPLGISATSTFVRLIFSILILIVQVPLMYGIIVTFMKMKRQEDVGIFEFCQIGFKNFKRCWKVNLWIFLKVFLIWFIIIVTLFAVSFICLLGLNISNIDNNFKSEFNLSNDDGSLNLSNINENFNLTNAESHTNTLTNIITLIITFSVALIIWITMGVFYFRCILRYQFAINISYDEPEITAKESVQKSKQMMKGNIGKLFVLDLSHIGWYILAELPQIITIFINNSYIIFLLTFFSTIMFIFVNTYLNMSQVCFYDKLKNNQ